MNWKKSTATAVLALVVIFCMTGCPKKPPATPGAPMGPDSTWTYATTVFKVWTTATGNIRYVMNWTDATDTSTLSYASGDTASVTHVWDAVGTYDVKAMAILDADPAKASEFSPAKSVKVILNNRPVVDSVQHPPVGVKDGETFITVYGSDVLDGDSLRVIVNWGGSKDTTTELFPTPCVSTVSHVFTSLGDATIIVWTQDWKGAKSLPDTIVIPIGTSGGVLWYWWSSDPENGEEPLTTSPIVANDGTDEVVLSSCEGDYKFYSIRASNGGSKKNQTTKETEGAFTSHPGFANGHIIVGSDEGELYALSLLDNLKVDWQFPDSGIEKTTGTEWGAPAFSGFSFYIGHDDDSIFKFADNGVAGTRVAAYGLHASVVDAPIVDASGNVIFATDSAFLYKMDANLNSPIWKSALRGGGEVFGPILGNDGTIYCTSDSSLLYAIDPTDGSVKSGWPLSLDGDVSRPALGQSALFIASAFGTAYSINPATGSINWEKALTTTDGFYTTPVVAANGYVYFQSDADMLYCVNQADGTVIWTCNCPNYLPRTGGGSPHRPRKLQLNGYAANPSITSTGDIIVAGDDACYCVAGYPEGPLDPAAAWPKWQKNLSNAGK
ncbi:MAG: PQQ-binding-like beta-propeller repeat protein [candidate division WOR-3 bacterium]|nr:PQQ-binding-like beta-propeller repeat protein [candidate division WOR-3 bacterium]